MTISVVIPTYNEAEGIVQCIESIMRNSIKPIEIIIADGGSTDKTVELAEQAGAIVYNNPNRTAASGRNVGILHAKGDIIAFTDGDNYVDEDWLKSILEEFQNDVELLGVGGKVVPAPPRTKVEKFWGNLWLNCIMSFGDEPYLVEKKTLKDAFITANCAYKRDLLDKLNGFDEWFGNNAEDVDLCWRALNFGAKLKYVPTAIVIARSPQKMKDMKKKSFRDGVSSTKLQKRYGPSKGSFDPQIHKMFWKNLGRMFLFKKGSYMLTSELFYHIMGKWYASIKYHYRNL